ncbi:c-type cytochrome [Thiobaca trueperi]|uniref:Mono/diheme cytochrome c family protein n=1 Tax=Thiobaca trueperi TaxID=127458 RepID=A0A4R3MVI2_9GAMM|nr:c-type cytochrome [Thiobaca trueperi]TCT19767.1 mono/diheme cytochrome c family protein [Thiobaca trueperi]
MPSSIDPQRLHAFPRAWMTGARLLFAAGALATAAQVRSAAPVAVSPTIDTTGLAALPVPWPAENPYRGDPLAARVGQDAFNQACARCHGPDADGSRAPAPDLRRLGRSCKRVSDADLKRRCIQDVDAYFRASVLKGKVKVGVVHMPAWDGILKPELVWAIRTFVETPAVTPAGAANAIPTHTSR